MLSAGFICLLPSTPSSLWYNTQTNRHERDVFLLLLTLLSQAVGASDLWMLDSDSEGDVCRKCVLFLITTWKWIEFHNSRCCQNTVSDAQLKFTLIKKLWCIFLALYNLRLVPHLFFNHLKGVSKHPNKELVHVVLGHPVLRIISHWSRLRCDHYSPGGEKKKQASVYKSSWKADFNAPLNILRL